MQFRHKLAVITALFCCTFAGAQTTQFTGTVKDLTNTPVASGQITFTLQPGADTTISGVARFTPNTVNCSIVNQAISAISRAANVVTVTTSSAHGFSTGDLVNIVGVTDTSYNANGLTITVTSSTQFTYAQTAGNSSSSGGFAGNIFKFGGTGACTVVNNTALTPGGTSYKVNLCPLFACTSQLVTFALGGVVDLTTSAPTPATLPTYSFVDTFSNQSIGGNKTFTGTFTTSGSVNLPTATIGTLTGTTATIGTLNAPIFKPTEVVIGSAFTAYGDSITACFGVVTSSNCFVNQIATAKGWTLTNQGVSGTGITDAGQIDTILASTVSTSSIASELCCVNDMRNNSGGGIITAAQQNDWESSLEAALLWLAVPDANKIKSSSGSVTYGGSWTASGAYGGLAKQTTAGTNTASFSVFGSSVYVVTLWQLSNTSTYTITLDGSASGAISTSAGAYTTLQGRTYGPLVTRYSGLTETTHTVVVTCSTADGSNPCYFLFAASGTGSATRTGPNVFAGNTIRFTSAGYVASGGSDAIASQFDLRMKEVVNELASDGMHVAYVDASGYYAPNGTNTQGDGVHPNDVGHPLIANAFLNEMSAYLEPKDRSALNILQNNNLCTLNGSWVLGSCAQTPVKGDFGGAGLILNGGTRLTGQSGSGTSILTNVAPSMTGTATAQALSLSSTFVTSTFAGITGATPSIAAGTAFSITQGGATNVTDFSGGTTGQIIIVRAGDGNSTLVHNNTVMQLKGSANQALATGNIVGFLRVGSVWCEIFRNF